MNSLALQLASLVKNNNGKFKSEKQAKFFLNNVDSDDYICMGGSMFGNTYTIFYHMDKIGVYKVEKHLFKTNKIVITFEREDDKEFAIKRAEKVKYSIKRLKERIENFSLLSSYKRQANKDLKLMIGAYRVLKKIPDLETTNPEFSFDKMMEDIRNLIKNREECSKDYRAEQFKELERLNYKLQKFEKELEALEA